MRSRMALLCQFYRGEKRREERRAEESTGEHRRAEERRGEVLRSEATTFKRAGPAPHVGNTIKPIPLAEV